MNCFNPELQLKNTESAIKNELIDLLSKLRGFKFVTVLEFTKIENHNETKYTTFCSDSKAEAIINTVSSTVNNSVVNTVFPIWSMTELPNLFPKCLLEYQNAEMVKSKFKSEKSKKNKHKNNVVLKENKNDTLK